MVAFRTAEGKSGHHQVESLDDAIRFVEHLRNNESIDEARVYRMIEVPIEVKSYFKVQVASEPGSGPALAAAPGAADSEPAEAQPTPATVGGERGLGFFGRH